MGAIKILGIRMYLKVGFCVSVFTNILLLSVYIHTNLSGQPLPLSLGDMEPPYTTSLPEGDERQNKALGDIFGRPETQHEEKLLYLAMLEISRSMGIENSDAFVYWRNATFADVPVLARKVQGHETVKALLIDRYGENAVDDPAFSRYFKPLGTEFQFLSSSKQIEILRLKTMYRHSLLSHTDK